MPRLSSANLADPAHQRAIGRGIATMNPIGPLVVGRAQLEPGWRWSVDLRPIVGTESCMVHHLLGGWFIDPSENCLAVVQPKE